MKHVGVVLALIAALATAGCQSSRKGDDLSGEIYPPPMPAASGATDVRTCSIALCPNSTLTAAAG